MPGFFAGISATAKAAGKLCVEKGWVIPTGEFSGKAKSRKELYQITPMGLQEILDHGETVSLLRQLQSASQSSAERLKAFLGEAEELRGQIVSLQAALGRHQEMVGQIHAKVKGPDIEAVLLQMAKAPCNRHTAMNPLADPWLDQALAYLGEYQKQHPSRPCSLPDLYRAVAQPRGLTIGQFHDGIRVLSREGRIILHEWTQAKRDLTDEQYALLEGKEIRYYAERRDR
jgi:hypothetical protein